MKAFVPSTLTFFYLLFSNFLYFPTFLCLSAFLTFSVKPQFDFETTDLLQKYELTESLHIKVRPLVPPKPPPEIQVVNSRGT